MVNAIDVPNLAMNRFIFDRFANNVLYAVPDI